jgi:hypothetical protein
MTLVGHEKEGSLREVEAGDRWRCLREVEVRDRL